MAKREPHWVKLFLRELERTGNVRISAERAGIDHTSVYQRRKRHAEFAERWEASLAAFRSGSGQAGARDEREGEGTLTLPQPAAAPSLSRERERGLAAEQALILPPPAAAPAGRSGPSPRRSDRTAFSPAGEKDLVVRPDGKVIRGNEARWGKRAEERFLTELTVSANVRVAAKAAGFSTTAVYKQRLKNRHFAAAWDAAVETGKARVQTYLVEAATRTFDPEELPIGDEREVPRVSISEAINIARLKPAGPALPAEDEAANYDDDYLSGVRERILDKLARLRERDLAEYGEAGWIEWQLPPRPNGGENVTVWLPPGWRLAGPEG